MANKQEITVNVGSGNNPFDGLLRSRKFWLAVVAFVQSIILQYFEVPDAIWQQANLLIGVVIAGIALEDYGEKRNPNPTLSPEVLKELRHQITTDVLKGLQDAMLPPAVTSVDIMESNKS